MYSRRTFGKLAVAGFPAIASAAKISSKLHGLQMGVAGYSYNTLPRQGLLDVIVNAMADAGIGDILLFAPSTEPVELADRARPARGGGLPGGGAPGGRGGSGGGRGGSGRGPGRAAASPEQQAALDELHKWHLTVSMDYYTGIRKKFADKGIEIHAFDASLGTTTADEDLNRACEVTKALGAQFMMTAVGKSVAKRLAPIAEKHGVKVGLQGRPNMNSTDPDALAKPSDFEEALAYSKNFGTSIDTGDATAGGWDALQYVRDNHARAFALNLKDRTKTGTSVPWGQGDTHMADILKLVRDKKYPIRCYIDCDFATAEGGSRVADVKQCFEFAKKVLG